MMPKAMTGVGFRSPPLMKTGLFDRAGLYTPVLVENLAAAYEMPPYARPTEGHLDSKVSV
jgi:hypothetical protein